MLLLSYMINTTNDEANKKIPLQATAVNKALPFIKKFSAKNGYMPTANEIALACGKTTAQWGRLAIQSLVSKGLIKKQKGKFRALTIL